MSDRQALLTAAFEALQEQIGTWTAAAGKVLAVVDTSVFLSHPAWTQDDDPTAVIASIPWPEELGVGFDDVLLVLPEVVIREFDRLKESGNQKTRYRASVTLAVIENVDHARSTDAVFRLAGRSVGDALAVEASVRPAQTSTILCCWKVPVDPCGC